MIPLHWKLILYLVLSDIELDAVNVFHLNGIFQENKWIRIFQESIFHVTLAITNYEELRTPDSRISIYQGFGNLIGLLELYPIYT